MNTGMDFLKVMQYRYARGERRPPRKAPIWTNKTMAEYGYVLRWFFSPSLIPSRPSHETPSQKVGPLDPVLPSQTDWS
jgi:hypothetical protein